VIVGGQRLELEFEAIVTVDARPHVERGGMAEIGAAVLEHDLGITDRKAVDVADTTPENEAVLVETEVWCVQKDDFADARHARGFGVVDEAELHRLRGTLDEFAELAESVRGRQPIGLQEQLGL
jgi:hypothetical protein